MDLLWWCRRVLEYWESGYIGLVDRERTTEITDAFQFLSEGLRMEQERYYEHALEFTLRPDIEGGYSDREADRGGPTNRGVTQETFDVYKKSMGLATRDVRTIRDDEVYSLYRDEYWLKAKCYLLPKALAICHFDSAVNHGPGRAVMFLQEVLNLVEDGIVGPKTRDAINKNAWRERVVHKYLTIRANFYYEIIRNDKTQEENKNGWFDRLEKLKQYISYY